jgi:hypothetical protein
LYVIQVPVSRISAPESDNFCGVLSTPTVSPLYLAGMARNPQNLKMLLRYGTYLYQLIKNYTIKIFWALGKPF